MTRNEFETWPSRFLEPPAEDTEIVLDGWPPATKEENLMVVWKYPVSASVEIPQGGKVLHVAWQGEEMMIWVLVDSNAALEKRHFAVYGTGQDLGDGKHVYIGTIATPGYDFVFHVFEVVS